MVFPVSVSIIYSPLIAVNTNQHLINIYISSSAFSHIFMLHSFAEQWSQQRLSSLLLWRVSFREKLPSAPGSQLFCNNNLICVLDGLDLTKRVWLGMLERDCWICESQKEMFIIQPVNLFLSDTGLKDIRRQWKSYRHECDNTALQLLTFWKSN